ncbi:MAG: aminopeptidase P family N-terminal domain-containing protein, partial [bacterium]
MRLANSRELKERHLKLLSRFKDLGIEALIVTHNPNVFYLSNHVGSSGYLLVTGPSRNAPAGAVHLLVDSRYAESAKRMQEDSITVCPSLQVWEVSSSYDETLVEGLASLEVSKVGFES